MSAQQLIEARSGASLITCACGATVRVDLNFSDGEHPVAVHVWHADGCDVGLWTDYPRPDEPTSGELLTRMVIPPEGGAELRDRLVNLVDSGECDPMCLFANPETARTCDCKCEGAHHGEMRWVD